MSFRSGLTYLLPFLHKTQPSQWKRLLSYCWLPCIAKETGPASVSMEVFSLQLPNNDKVINLELHSNDGIQANSSKYIFILLQLDFIRVAVITQ
jgi:hypothetical protein